MILTHSTLKYMGIKAGMTPSALTKLGDSSETFPGKLAELGGKYREMLEAYMEKWYTPVLDFVDWYKSNSSKAEDGPDKVIMDDYMQIMPTSMPSIDSDTTIETLRTDYISDAIGLCGEIQTIMTNNPGFFKNMG